MLENPTLLKELGILYPKHTLTASGVSAGNWSALFDKKDDKTPSSKKISKLISQFENSTAQVLLLSSENFFGRIHVLAEAIPEARFIFYLRNPLALAESLYNQNVKNFGETETFEIKTRRPNFGTIGHIRDFVKANGSDKLIVKYFHPQFYHRGNIINDIIETMGISYNVDIKSPPVNLSYTLEALETKRFLNNFKLSPYSDYTLNNLLQQNQEGTLNYSLLKPEDFSRHLQHVIDELQLFFQEITTTQSDEFLEALKQTKQKEYFIQATSINIFNKNRDYIYSKNPALYYELCRLIALKKAKKPELQSLQEEFTKKYSNKATTRLYFRLKYKIDKAIFINKLRINKYLG